MQDVIALPRFPIYLDILPAEAAFEKILGLLGWPLFLISRHLWLFSFSSKATGAHSPPRSHVPRGHSQSQLLPFHPPLSPICSGKVPLKISSFYSLSCLFSGVDDCSRGQGGCWVGCLDCYLTLLGPEHPPPASTLQASPCLPPASCTSDHPSHT